MAKEQTELRGSKVAVLGAGREGLASVRWLNRHAAEVAVRDRSALTAEAAAELRRLGVPAKTGPRYLDGLDRFDLAVRSPGIRLTEPRLAKARRSGRLTSQTRLFFERCPARIVGVTGTKGKGTTSSLLARMLKAGGKRVWLGGNIGKPMFDFLDSVKRSDLVVLELSSYQLQDLERSPHVAVVTNVTADHLDHHRSLREYRSAKRSITKCQQRSDVAILNADDRGSRLFANDPGRVRRFSTRGRADASLKDGWLVVRGKALAKASDLKVPGEHNQQNALAAALAANEFGVGLRAVGRALRDFRGLPYHLEYLGTKRGIIYFNDSYATSETAAIPAVASIGTPLVLIVGGQGKGLGYDELARTLAKQDVRGIVAIPPEGTKVIAAVRRAFRRANKPVPKTVAVRRKQDIVPAARTLAAQGDTVLLSPAATSFGWFTSYTDRGRYFTEQVKRIPS